MSSLNTNSIIVPADKHYEKVFLNASSLDLHFTQEAGSTLKLHILYLHTQANKDSTPIAPKNKVTITVEQKGKGCRTEIYGLAFLHGNEQVDMTTNIQHLASEGKSQQTMKYVLDDAAQGAFCGRLLIAPDAQQTEAYQTNRNLLLSDKAQMRTRPQLEIYADDVKATHGATTGQLDESALFYMQQRGLSPQTARLLLVAAFMKDVLSTITDDALRTQLLELVEPPLY